MSRPRALEPDATAERLLLVLAELAGDPPRGLSPLEAGRRVLRRGVEALGASGGTARVVDSRRQDVDIVESRSEQAAPAAAAELVARAEEGWFSTHPEIGARGALAAVRVELGGLAAGGVAVWFEEERSFSAAERSFLRALGRVLAQEVDRSSLLAQHRDDVREREKVTRWADGLSDAFQLVSSRAALGHILDEMARLSCDVPADYCGIRVLSADRRWLEFRALHHRDPVQGERLRAVLQHCPMPASAGETARVLETGKSLLTPMVDMEAVLRTTAGTPLGDYLARHPVSSAMTVPLVSRGSIFGVVTVARIAPHPFQPADLRFLERVADRAGAAMENTELLEKLTHSEEQLRVALEAGQLGAWDWDIPAGKVNWSSMLEQIHGLDPGRFPGTFDAYRRDIHPEDRERVLSSITRTVETRADHHIVYRIVRPDGQVRWVEAHGRVLSDQAGVPKRMVGVCVDVTERRRSEEQLRQMVLALRDADQRKDQFLAMLAHELRNPLGPMVNATYLLRVPGVDEHVAASARDILDRQVRHMARLLDDLLDVSRITRGKIEFCRELVDLTALAREVVGDHLETFRAAELTLELSMPAGPLVVYADRARLAQIVGNLLSNALKFSQAGQSVRVRVAGDPPSRHALLTVRDEGAGIEPALLDSIFEPFVQAETSLSRPRGGLGLGLAVVKGLVALHGGRVSAWSEGPGQGAELRVELPLHAGPRAVSESSAPPSESPRGASATVLVFEDNADAAESLRAVLSASGYRVCVERTGRAATEVVRRIQPAIVLCDLGLPDRDGYAIAADIRSDHELAALPLIAISGYGATEDQARSRRAGFDLHLTKPVSPGLLLSELSGRIARVPADGASES
jgi:PAS domain S-box-containing protein